MGNTIPLSRGGVDAIERVIAWRIHQMA